MGFLGPMRILILGRKKIQINWPLLYVILAECGYEILVRKICIGGRISYILTNFIQNITVPNNKHLTYN